MSTRWPQTSDQCLKVLLKCMYFLFGEAQKMDIYLGLKALPVIFNLPRKGVPFCLLLLPLSHLASVILTYPTLRTVLSTRLYARLTVVIFSNLINKNIFIQKKLVCAFRILFLTFIKYLNLYVQNNYTLIIYMHHKMFKKYR